MEDWAEVHRLFHREGLAKAAIARRLGMSRNTVARLLELDEPPRYGGRRRARSSTRSPTAIAAMLDGGPDRARDGHPRAPPVPRRVPRSLGIRMAIRAPTPVLGCSSEKLNLGPPASPAASHGGRTPWMRWNRVDAAGWDGASYPGPFVGLALLRPVDPFDDRRVMVRRAVASRTRRAGPGGGRRR